MLRSVHVFLPVAGDPAALQRAFVNDPGRWLPDARNTGLDRWVITVHAGQLAHIVTVRVGRPWRAGATHWRLLSWDPVGEDATQGPIQRLLPSMDGELGLHGTADRATLMLDARYRPPGGAVGAALDSVALRRVARLTMQRLVSDLAARLCAESVLLPAAPKRYGTPATPATMQAPRHGDS